MAVMRRVSHLPAAAFVLVFSTLGTHAWAADTRLADAAMKRDVATVRKLLDEKVDVNAPGADANASDKQGETALMTATKVGSVDAVKTLLDHGAQIDSRDPAYQQTALMMAVREDHPDVVKLLVDRGAKVSVQTRTGATPAWILPNSVPGFGHGIGIVRGGLPDRGLRNFIPGAMSPLMYAARDGRLDIVQTLLAAKADVNQADAN